MSTDRDIEKILSGMDLKKGTKRVVVEYGRGMKDGMHLAYTAVARKLLSQGGSAQEVRRFLADMTDAAELKAILMEAQGEA